MAHLILPVYLLIISSGKTTGKTTSSYMCNKNQFYSI